MGGRRKGLEFWVLRKIVGAVMALIGVGSVLLVWGRRLTFRSIRLRGIVAVEVQLLL